MQFIPQKLRAFRYSIVALDKVDRYSEGGGHYIPVRYDDLGWTMVHEADHAREFTITHADMYRRLEIGDALIDWRFHAPEVQRLRLIWGDVMFESLEPAVKAVARRKEWFVLKYDAFFAATRTKPFWSRKLDFLLATWNCERLGISLGTLSKRKRGRKKRTNQVSEWDEPPSWKSVQRWWREYHDSERNVLCLVDRNTGQHSTRIHIRDVEGYSFAYRSARHYLERAQETPEDIFTRYKMSLFLENEARRSGGKSEFEQIGRTAFLRIIDSFDAFEVACARKGERWAKEHFSLNAGTVDAALPGELIQMDYVMVDLITFLVVSGVYAYMPQDLTTGLPPVRFWLCVAVDVSTRYVFGMTASLQPTGKAVIECLRLVMTDKRDLSEAVGAETPWFGAVKPTLVEMDNGAEFIDGEVIAAFKAAGVGLERKRAKHPSDRPMAESLFHSIAPLLVRFYDGRTFRSVSERGNYDSIALASLFSHEFLRFAILALCDVYHRKGHGSLGGRCPHNALCIAAEGSPLDQMFPREQLNAFGIRSTAKLNDYGVVHAGISYANSQLQALRNVMGHNAEVTYRYDPFNLVGILVKGPQGEFFVKNTIGIEERIALEDWTEARRRLRQEIREGEKESLAVMYRCLAKLYASGEASRARAGLSLRTLSEKDYAMAKRDVFKEWVVERDEGGTLPRLGPIAPDRVLIANHLLETVAPPKQAKKRSRKAASTAAAEPPVALSAPDPDAGSHLRYNDED